MNVKRKEYLKNWVEVVIVFIQVILFMTLAGDCDNITTFIISKLIILILIYVNHNIIKRYTKIYN